MVGTDSTSLRMLPHSSLKRLILHCNKSYMQEMSPFRSHVVIISSSKEEQAKSPFVLRHNDWLQCVWFLR